MMFVQNLLAVLAQSKVINRTTVNFSFITAYFSKSIKIGPGVHINLSKRGTGVSLGSRGAHVSFSLTGRVTKTVNRPGAGLLQTARYKSLQHGLYRHSPIYFCIMVRDFVITAKEGRVTRE